MKVTSYKDAALSAISITEIEDEPENINNMLDALIEDCKPVLGDDMPEFMGIVDKLRLQVSDIASENEKQAAMDEVLRVLDSIE